jgi:lipoate-protein ligase A
LLDQEYDDPFMNMAVEEAIPRMVGRRIVPCTLRLWRNSNAVVIGNFQSVNLEVNIDACKRYDTQIVRRFTGGGSVYQDRGNLNYAISIPVDHRLVQPTDPIRTFRHFSEGVLQSLRILGLSPKIKSLNSIEVNEKKLCGVAGSIRWGTLFHHSSIIVCSNLDILNHILRSEDYSFTQYVKSSRTPVTTISKEINRPITTGEVSDILVRCFGEIFDVELWYGTLTKKEKKLADELYERCSSHRWNFKM